MYSVVLYSYITQDHIDVMWSYCMYVCMYVYRGKLNENSNLLYECNDLRTEVHAVLLVH